LVLNILCVTESVMSILRVTREAAVSVIKCNLLILAFLLALICISSNQVHF